MLPMPKITAKREYADKLREEALINSVVAQRLRRIRESTIGENGYPSGTPLNYADDGDNIYVHFAAGSALKNAALNPKVCFTVVTRCDVIPPEFAANYESVMAFGTAEEVHGQEKYDALHLHVKKYAAEFEKEGLAYIGKGIDNCRILKIKIDLITGKARMGT